MSEADSTSGKPLTLGDDVVLPVALIPDDVIEDIASVCHTANRRLQFILGEEPNPGWEAISEEMRDSARDGVRKALAGATAKQLHESWCEFKFEHGWTWGEVKDEAAKTHPCLVEYDDLPEEQRIKDRMFFAIVAVLAGG